MMHLAALAHATLDGARRRREGGRRGYPWNMAIASQQLGIQQEQIDGRRHE